MEETDFYEKFFNLKNRKSLKWSAFGNVLNMTDATIRMAFRNKSLKEVEKQKMEIYFENYLEKSHIETESPVLVKDGVSVSIDEIMIFASKNKEKFYGHPIADGEIELRVTKRLMYYLQNPKSLKELLES